MAEFDPSEFKDFKTSAGTFDPKEFAAAVEKNGRLYVAPEGAPKRPDIGQGRAALEGALQGVSANFSDEIYGASKASGLPEWLGGYRAPVGAAKLAYEGLTGQNDPKYAGSLPDVLGVSAPTEPPKRGDATKIYEEEVANKRQVLKDAAEQYPKTFIASELAGGLALPVGAGGQAATLPLRAVEMAKTGALYGATAGAGAGEGAADTAVKAGVGGLAGGAVGAVAAPVMEGVATVARAGYNKAADLVQGALKPEEVALRKFGAAVKQDANIDPTAQTRLTPTELGSTDTAMLGDMGGPVTRRLADTAAIVHPETGGAINKALTDRAEGQFDRISDWLKGNFNYPNPSLQKEAIQKAATEVNSERYKRAMTEGAGGVWTPELQRLAGSPSIQDAAQGAIKGLQDRGISEGFRAPRSMPLEFNPETGRATLAKTANGNEIVPDLRFWDQVKRGLDAGIDRAGDREAVSRLTGLKKSLVAELDNAVPSYAQARAGAAHFFGEENALDAGKSFVINHKISNDDARRELAKMKPNERQLFQDGFIAEYIDTLSRVGDRRNILNKIAENPKARERLEIVMGKEKYAEFDTKLRIEGIQQLAKDAIQGNSWTARRLTDLGLMGGGAGLGAVGTYNMDPKEMVTGAVIAAIASGGKRIDARVSQKIGEMFMSKDPMLMDRALKLVSNNPIMRKSLIDMDKRIVASGAERPAGAVPQIAGPQSMSPAAAQQPDGEGSATTLGPRSDAGGGVVMSDADPEPIRVGAQYAQASPIQMRPIGGGMVQVINIQTGQILYTGSAAGASNAQASAAGQRRRIID